MPTVVVTKGARWAEHDKNNHIGETPCLKIILYYFISPSVNSFATHSMKDRFWGGIFEKILTLSSFSGNFWCEQAFIGLDKLWGPKTRVMLCYNSWFWPEYFLSVDFFCSTVQHILQKIVMFWAQYDHLPHILVFHSRVKSWWPLMV